MIADVADAVIWLVYSKSHPAERGSSTYSKRHQRMRYVLYIDSHRQAAGYRWKNTSSDKSRADQEEGRAGTAAANATTGSKSDRILLVRRHSLYRVLTANKRTHELYTCQLGERGRIPRRAVWIRWAGRATLPHTPLYCRGTICCWRLRGRPSA